ncbi:GNAT family N-acetyltransferase [Kitasatospora indigofera]|uniref:GNAT family N-acetyltransferase n=1 Tax=Kitasatospora indigofera TaxID=67307 RepID=UPI0033B5615A
MTDTVATSLDIRALRAADSTAIADLYLHDRHFLRMWEPEEADAFFTGPGQREAVESTLRECAGGRMLAWVIVAGGEIVGRVNLNNLAMGPLRSCSIGYWVAQRYGGRGYASFAVESALDIAFHDLNLHRVDAFARLDNARSLRVLEKNGFRTVGVSRGHLHVGGRWQDELYLQRLAPWDDGVQLEPAFATSILGES